MGGGQRCDIFSISLDTISLSARKMSAQRDIGLPEDLENTLKEVPTMVDAIVFAIVYVFGVCATKDAGYMLTGQQGGLC
jgi:hypothetical protein